MLSTVILLYSTSKVTNKKKALTKKRKKCFFLFSLSSFFLFCLSFLSFFLVDPIRAGSWDQKRSIDWPWGSQTHSPHSTSSWPPPPHSTSTLYHHTPHTPPPPYCTSSLFHHTPHLPFTITLHVPLHHLTAHLPSTTIHFLFFIRTSFFTTMFLNLERLQALMFLQTRSLIKVYFSQHVTSDKRSSNK